MNINADFAAEVVVHSAELAWVDSPIAGVSRRPLDRVGDEVARATSVVRYAPASKFSAHTHTGGEEFLVLAGVFQDEHGDYPVGSYVRNPPNTRHTPGSQTGCIILVKLWQFDPADKQQLHISAADMRPVTDPQHHSISRIQLFENDDESVSIQTWKAGFEQTISCLGGIEIFVLSGEFEANGHDLRAESWMRLPIGSGLDVKVTATDVRVWVKQRHLSQVPAQLARLRRAL